MTNEEEIIEIQNERIKLAGDVKKIEFWLARNKTHFKYDQKLKDYQQKLNRLREINNFNKQRGQTENLILANIFCDSARKEVYNKAKREVKSRIDGNTPNIISLLTDDESSKIEKFDTILSENIKIKKNIFFIVKGFDEMIIETKGNLSPEEWNRIQNFNKNILKSKRLLNELVK